MTDEEFEQQVRDKQHNELVKSLQAISTILANQPKPDFSLIAKSNELIIQAIGKLKIDAPKIPDNKVEIEGIIRAVEVLNKNVTNSNLLLEKLVNNKNPEYEFTFVRNNFTDLIQKVIAKTV